MQNPGNAATQIPVWVPIVVSLIGDGAMGAILKWAFDTYQRRIQPVDYRMRFTKIFKETVGMSSLKAELKISDDVETRYFQNLFIADINLTNRGNAHIDEFPFGITLGVDDVALYIQTESPDRHHTITQITQVALGATAKGLSAGIFLNLLRRTLYPVLSILPSASHVLTSLTKS